MKSLTAILIFTWILAVAVAETAVPYKQESEWPKIMEKETVMISIYQPQINSLDGDVLDARAALSIKKKGESLIFGAIWFKSRLVTDFDTRLVSLTDINVESAKIPNASEEEEVALINLLETEIPEMDMTFSLDRLLTSLEMVEKSNELSEQLNHTPPKVFFENEAAVLVLIDGEPILQDIEDTKIQYVANTPYFILYNKADGFFYLKGGDWWYRAGRVEDTWREADNPPNSILEIRPTEDAAETDVDSIARTMKYPPKVILSKVPAELIITDGEPDFATLEGTDLLYVRNTESEILMDINTQDYYILIAGRWYKSKSLESDGLVYVNPDDLPEYFANINTDSEMGSVRSSIPNTQEAREARLENDIPQTAEINRKEARVEVSYDGNPEFERIQGTEMAYAVNTDKSVLYIDNRYYCVDNAVWFVSNQAAGPWDVCVSVPDQVQAIPPEYPVYNVKYVHVYDYTPDVVYVGYTPGYVHSYSYHGTVVYGTGYHYNPWYRTYYYPRPVTYGYGVHYNPYSGWGFSVGVSYGWVGYTHYRSPYYYTSWWGPAGYQYGYRHGYYSGYDRGYYKGYYHGYNYGVYTSSRSGYSAGYYNGHSHHSNGYNVYSSRSTGVIHTGTKANSYGSRTGSGGSRSSYSNSASSERKNNVYTDKSGNVYRQKGDNWQSRDEGSWKKSDIPERSRSSSQATSTVRSTETRTGTTTRSSSGTTPSNTQTQRSSQVNSYQSNQQRSSSSSTRQELSRESQARSQGTQRSNNYQKSQQQPAQGTDSRTRSSSPTKPTSTSRTPDKPQPASSGVRKR